MKNNKLAQVFHFDLYGKRESKYDFLKENNLKNINWKELEYSTPYYFFVPKNFDEAESYEKGFKVEELFGIYTSGVKTHDDAQLVSFEHFIGDTNRKYTYKLFDNRNIDYNLKKVKRHRFAVMKNMLKSNYGICLMRGLVDTDNFSSVFITQLMLDINFYRFQTYIFPLYLYPDDNGQQNIDTTSSSLVELRKPNLNMDIVNKISEGLGLIFTNEKTALNSHPAEGWIAKQDGVVSYSSTSESQNHDRVDTTKKLRNTRKFLNLPYNPELKIRAKELRKAGNLSEVLLWNQIKNKIFEKLDFDRQKIIGNYIVDFYCSSLGLVIEIDGSNHNDKLEYDAKRQEYLESLGLIVFRVADIDVKNNMDGVLDHLNNFIKESNSNSQDKTTSSDFVSHSSAGGEFEEMNAETYAPIDLLDYIYAVLHSPNYREKYKEFLKIDFPRVPYPKDKNTFWKLVALGSEIRQIHLLESPIVEDYITQYPKDGTNLVEKITYLSGKVYINEIQYFDNVPEIAWNFYIGGYQPAQKWLKDRKGRNLDFDDILHYQKIIVALTETNRIMNEIDKIGIE